MTPPATTVASDVQSLVARKAASPVDFRPPHERPITMGWQVPL